MSQQGSPGRYERSPNALIASLAVTVVVILAFFLFRQLFTESYEDKPANLDYLDTVASLEEGGFQVVYPPSLPDGWIARNVEVGRVDEPGQQPSFELSMLTDDEKYVGLHQDDVDVDELLDTYVDEFPQRGDVLEVDGSVAPAWQEWSDDGGDHAFTAKVGEQTVIVFGSAPVADLETIVRSLTDTMLAAASAPPSTSVTPVDPSPTG